MRIARGMVRAGSRTSSPIVAIRAYPAKAKNNSPAACRTPYSEVPVRDGRSRLRPTGEEQDQHQGEHHRVQETRIRVSRAVLVTPR